MSTDTLADCRAICRPICRSRGAQYTHDPRNSYVFLAKHSSREILVFLAKRSSREILMFFLHCLIELMFLELDVFNDYLILKARLPKAWLHFNLEHAQYEKCRPQAESPSSS